MKHNISTFVALITAGLLCSNTLIASAEEIIISETEGTHSGETPSTMTIKENLIADGATVTLPADLNLTYNETYDAFVARGYVQVQGELRPTTMISVSLNQILTYKNANSDRTLTGYANFGNKVGNLCVASWNAEQVEEEGSSKPITIQVPADPIVEAGDYNASVEFEIQVESLGIRNEICEPTKISAENGIQANPTSYSWNEDCIHYKSINLANLTPINQQSTPFYATNDNVCTTLRYLEIGAGNGKITYTRNWLSSFPNLTALVIPAELKSYQLEGALSFAKEIEDGGFQFYVPHIMYRGTCDAWKALSDAEDWNFGDNHNIVTIHCTDGTLIYA